LQNCYIFGIIVLEIKEKQIMKRHLANTVWAPMHWITPEGNKFPPHLLTNEHYEVSLIVTTIILRIINAN